MSAFIRLKRSFSSIFLIASYFLIASLSHAADPIGVLSVVIGSVSIEREVTLRRCRDSRDRTFHRRCRHCVRPFSTIRLPDRIDVMSYVSQSQKIVIRQSIKEKR
ncbi:MAG: hypothetical protein O3C12_06235 [Proteobacteria bacterium]|nr:hypothetical protein [Pseudomonadota bacterium]